MDADQPNSFNSAPPVRGRKSKKKLVWLIIIILILALIGAGIYVMQDELLPSQEAELSPTPSYSFTPTPTEIQANREEISIMVLNGSGVSGEAGFLKEQLVDLGYESDSIETKNASTQNLETTTVSYSASLPENLQEEITQLLTGLYKKVEVDKTSPAAGIDVQIVVGLRKGQTKSTPTPTKAAVPTSTGSATLSPTNTTTPTP